VAGLKRVGHTGTLDPAAAGVLPVCLGQATRLAEYLPANFKEYSAELTFGYETDTLDAVGVVVRQAPTQHINLESLRAVLDQFRGTITQTPALYSAIKQDGRKLYELARAGVDVDDVAIKTRQVRINELIVTRFVAGERPRAMLRIQCGSGTYIRSLARDVGRALDSAATMTFLVRTRSGKFTLDEAHSLEEIANDWQSVLLPMTEALRRCASLVVTDDEATQQLSQGRSFTPNFDRAMHHKNDCNDPAWFERWPAYAMLRGTSRTERVVFFNTEQTTAVLTSRVLPQYKPEKVFFLDRDS
ncbi:MAG TPA: tRNA pseudouridine(55) synthase TruB, partial [Abditibacteriaceae bacterium]|nr:tRNA pseudouridine(55) synthase TruB [Abditibacteriaceae bacterium]